MAWLTWLVFGTVIVLLLVQLFSKRGYTYHFKSEEVRAVPKDQLAFVPPSLPYTIHEYPHLLSKQECRELRDLVLTDTTKDQVVSVHVPWIETMVSQLTNQPVEHMEPLEIHRVTKGGSVPRVDANENTYSQTRIATVVFYLNEEYMGGGLVFPDVNRTIVPTTGKAVLYWNMVSNHVLKESLHRDKFVLRGVQWKAIQYVHNTSL